MTFISSLVQNYLSSKKYTCQPRAALAFITFCPWSPSCWNLLPPLEIGTYLAPFIFAHGKGLIRYSPFVYIPSWFQPSLIKFSKLTTLRGLKTLLRQFLTGRVHSINMVIVHSVHVLGQLSWKLLFSLEIGTTTWPNRPLSMPNDSMSKGVIRFSPFMHPLLPNWSLH